MKRQIEDLEQDVRKQKAKYRKLEERVKKLEALVEERPATKEPVPDVGDQQRNAIKNFCTSDIVPIIKALALSIFTREELALKSISGKKCAKSGEQPREALDQEKIALVEKLFREKCPETNHKVFMEKFQNIQKVIRRDMKK